MAGFPHFPSGYYMGYAMQKKSTKFFWLIFQKLSEEHTHKTTYHHFMRMIIIGLAFLSFPALK